MRSDYEHNIHSMACHAIRNVVVIVRTANETSHPNQPVSQPSIHPHIVVGLRNTTLDVPYLPTFHR